MINKEKVIVTFNNDYVFITYMGKRLIKHISDFDKDVTKQDVINWYIASHE